MLHSTGGSSTNMKKKTTILSQFEGHILSTTEGFTLMEILLVISLAAMIILALLILINPKKQFDRAQDGKRKQELTQLAKSVEEFYNDNERYPDAPEICYTAEEVDGQTCSCSICGIDPASPDFSPYLRPLPCDPSHPNQGYLYQYECTTKKWFKLYGQLSDDSENYSYGQSSANISLLPYPSAAPTAPVSTTYTPTPAGSDCVAPIYCKKDGICNLCGTSSDCADASRCTPGQYYNNSGCVNACTLN